MLSYLTAGESHGKYLVALIEGLPVGITIDIPFIKSELKRRRCCVGRSARAQSESDRLEIITGLRKGKTIGAPITILIANKKVTIDTLPPLTRLRPGHIDIAGAVKFGLKDVRGITERASARETVTRVAAGALAKILLKRFNIQVISYVNKIGGIDLSSSFKDATELLRKRTFYAYGLNKKLELLVKKKISESKKKGDTLGGVFTVIAFHVPAGLGSHSQWNLRLDSRLAANLMAIPAVKGVEIGLGFGYRNLPGSLAQDLIKFSKGCSCFNKGGGFSRLTNNAGGIEGGISNGENIIVRAVVKPIPTLKTPLKSIDLKNNKTCSAQVESADICAVPAASVVGESVIAFELARAFLEKFGGDTLQEVIRHFNAYRQM